MASPAGAQERPGEPLPLSAVARRLDAERPDLTRVGHLAWRGGLELSSTDDRFGGLSGLLVSPDGTRLTAVGDQGSWVTAGLHYDRRGWLTGISDARIGRLADAHGRPLPSIKAQEDAEGLARLSEARLLVAFERDHRLQVHAASEGAPAGPATRLPPPEGLDPGSNGGLEALAALPDGRLLAFAEPFLDDDLPNRWRGHLRTDGAWADFDYLGAIGMSPVGADALPDGTLLLVERAFSLLGGIRVRVSRLDAAALRPGTAIAGEPLAELRPPLLTDNFEALALRRGGAGELLVYLLSDDNFSPLQRSLLVMFELVD